MKKYSLVTILLALTFTSCNSTTNNIVISSSLNENTSIDLTTSSETTSSDITSTINSSTSEVHTHEYSKGWTFDENYHWHASTCGHDVVSNYEPHTFVKDITKTDVAPTYSDEGIEYLVCSVCKYEKENVIPAIGYSFEMSFIDVASLVAKAAKQEAKESNKEIVKKSDAAGQILKEETFTYNHYKNNVCGFTSIVNQIEGDDEITLSDTSVGIKKTAKEKIEVDNVVNTYNMYVEAVDYKNDSFKTNYYDYAVKKYIVNSSSEATEAGLDNDQYVLSSNIQLETTGNSTTYLYNYIYNNLIGNYYLEATEQTEMYCSISEETMNASISFMASFTLQGEGSEEIDYYYVFQIGINMENYQLNTSKCSVVMIDRSTVDETDQYMSALAFESEITYGDRTDAPNDLLDPNKFFLEKISDIELRTTYNDLLDPKQIETKTMYFRGVASSFYPETALDVGLTPISSSNEKVCVLTKNTDLFEVVGTGDSTLTFSFYGLDSDNVYRIKEITIDITVISAIPTSLIFGYCSELVDDTLYVGDSVTISTIISPSKASQEVSVEITSGSAYATVELCSNKSSFTLTGVAQGDVVVKAISVANPAVYATKTYHVVNKAEVNIEDYLVSNTFFYDCSIYGYTLTLSFDGTTMTDDYYEIGKDKHYFDTFSYVIEDDKIVLSNPSTGAYPNFPYLEIKTNKDGDIYLRYEDSSTYKEYIFEVVK